MSEASARLHSERQGRLKEAFGEIDRGMGAHASGVVDAIGAWTQGAENSTLTVYKDDDYGTIRAVTAMKGLLAEQRAVLTFKYDKDGKHAMLSATFKGSLQEVHDGLISAGITNHTLVPKGDGFEVHVFGNTKKVSAGFKKYIEDNNGTKRKVSRGRGDFIPPGFGSREEGAKAYEKELDRYFSRGGMGGRYAEWRRIRDNWREAALKAEAELAKAFEFIRLQKNLETKIARVMVKSAFSRQHARVEKQAARKLALYFRASVNAIVTSLPRFTPDPEHAREQAAELVQRAFKASKQNDLLIAIVPQTVADAFLEGAYAEMRLTAAARRRRKGGPGSGHHGHAGRPGEVGGSSAGHWSATAKVPPKAGTTPIPEGHIRLYHYTKPENYDDDGKHRAGESLLEHGIDISRARGSEYGEPNVVWASAQPPSKQHVYAEFHVPADDPGLVIKPDPGADLRVWESRNPDTYFSRSIKPEEIIGVPKLPSRPWSNR